MKIPRLLSVAALPEFTLRLTFADGEVRLFDCKPYLSRGVFVRLHDPSAFAQVYLAADTACWPGGLDIAPATLYLRSTIPSVVGASALAQL